MEHARFETPEYWNRRHEGDNWGKEKEPEPRVLAFFEKHKDAIGPVVLEVASGAGRHLVPAAEKGYRMIGMDFSATGHGVTKAKLEEKGLKADLIVADFHKAFPLEDASVDTVFSTQAYNRNDWEGAKHTFRETARVLRPGGLFFLRVRSSSIPPNPENKPERDVEIIAEAEDPEIPVTERGITYKETKGGEGRVIIHAYSKEELVALGRKYGLEMIEEPVDEKIPAKDGKPAQKGQWNVVYRKVS